MHLNRLSGKCLPFCSGFNALIKCINNRHDTVYGDSSDCHWYIGHPILTHWGWDKMANISQAAFSNVFSSMEMFELWLKFHLRLFLSVQLTHWGRVTHICVRKLIIIGSDNGLSPGRCQAIIWNNDEILLIGPLGTNFDEISIEIYTFLFKKVHLKISSEICSHFVSASMC